MRAPMGVYGGLAVLGAQRIVKRRANTAQIEPKGDQKGTKRVPTSAKVAPKSCLGAFEVVFFIEAVSLKW